MAFLLMVVLLVAQVAPAPPPGPDYIEINGATNPEQIPEYLVWSSGFDTIAFLTAKGVTEHGPLTALDLTRRDRELMLAAVAAHRKRRIVCQEHGERIARSFLNDNKKLEAGLKEHTLLCRQALLDAKDELLAAMSSEGGTELTVWMLDERRKMKSYVLKSDLEFYRLPR